MAWEPPSVHDSKILNKFGIVSENGVVIMPLRTLYEMLDAAREQGEEFADENRRRL